MYSNQSGGGEEPSIRNNWNFLRSTSPLTRKGKKVVLLCRCLICSVTCLNSCSVLNHHEAHVGLLSWFCFICKYSFSCVLCEINVCMLLTVN